MEEWKEYRLGDIGRIITGKTPSTACKTNYGGKTPFLTPSDDLSVKHTYKNIITLSTCQNHGVKRIAIHAVEI